MPVSHWGGRRWSLRARFMLVASASLLPLLGVALFVLYQSLNFGRDQLLETQVTAAEAVARSVGATVGDYQEMLQELATQPAVQRLDPKKAGAVIGTFERARPKSLYGLFLVGRDGQVIASTAALDQGPLPIDLRPALEPALGPGEFGVSDLVVLPSGDEVVAIVGPVRSEGGEGGDGQGDATAGQTGQTGQPVAAVGALLSAEQLRDTVIPFARSGETVIGVVAGKQILATRATDSELSDADLAGRLREPLAAAAAGSSGTFTYKDETGIERLAAYAPVDAPGTDWAVFVSRPSPTDAGPNRALLERGLAALGLAMTATLFLAIVLSEWVARPLRLLTAQAVAIAGGDFGQRMPAAGGGEVATLSHAFGEMADRLGSQVRDLEAARAAGAAQSEQLRDLLRRTVRLQEDERRRIAGDIHDAVTPLITGALYQARALRLSGADLVALQNSRNGGEGENHGTPATAPDDLDAIGDLLTRAMEELHGVIFALRPPDLDDLGVVAAIERYVAQISRAGLNCRLEVVGEPPGLTPEVRLAVYRIVQEALHNALRHAAADEAVVSLDTSDGLLRVTVGDNGAGFDPDHPARPAALGLLGMRERATAIGATLTVSSRPGDGTRVVIERPLESPPLLVVGADEVGPTAADPSDQPDGDQPPQNGAVVAALPQLHAPEPVRTTS